MTAAAEPTEPLFGRRAPEGYEGARWGARAIYTDRCVIDILPDRQGFAGGDLKARKALMSWLNGTGLRDLRKLVKAQWLSRQSAEVVAVERDGYRLEASPQRSHGYLYMGAWKLPAAAAVAETAPPAKPKRVRR